MQGKETSGEADNELYSLLTSQRQRNYQFILNKSLQNGDKGSMYDSVPVFESYLPVPDISMV